MNYFVRTASGAEHGPLSASQLREAARAGSLRRGDLVRPEGSVDWFRADRVRGLEFGASAPEVVRPSIAAAVSPSESALEVRSSEPEPTTRSDPSPTADGLIRHIEPLALRGFNVRKLDGFVKFLELRSRESSNVPTLRVLNHENHEDEFSRLKFRCHCISFGLFRF